MAGLTEPSTQPAGTDTQAASPLFAVRRPIFDLTEHVYGYELLCRPASANGDEECGDTGVGVDALGHEWLTVVLPELIGSRKAVITLTRELLVTGYAGHSLPSQQ